MLFQENGDIDIGFEINRHPKYVLRLNKGTMIGAYNCFENRKTLFVYRSYTKVKGFMLRKNKWLDLVEDIPELGDNIKQNIRIEYV